jgi:hypothetical protein
MAHGLPLTLADRLAAAARIVTACPYWSDRAVAAVAGLSPKTVTAVLDPGVLRPAGRAKTLTDFAVVDSYLDTAAKWGLDKLHVLQQLFTTGAWLPPALTPAHQPGTATR